MARELLSLGHTKHIIPENGPLFTEWKSEEWRVQEGGREKEGTQNHVRPPQGGFVIV